MAVTASDWGGKNDKGSSGGNSARGGRVSVLLIDGESL